MDRTSGQPQVKMTLLRSISLQTGVETAKSINQLNITGDKTKKAEMRRGFVKGQILRVWM
jgi:hypothetical protein